ncbi:uroporphyrinogen-III C-methyltransferase [Saccharospirillum salsuginis]|uniref:Uroporphyrin-3 C-methyltransferase n=1 Tax=Saccharospirillum salsuginis TaxID=418750 RepID=A0A918K1Q0_9GAMM|nr:uroporphyrinogen-III C-methyltransferase [Saccharospirillum salsuginis]GGX44633.1 hypothetical protein GCM10007392_09280 [Saccharospirillum salsuginis]
MTHPDDQKPDSEPSTGTPPEGADRVDTQNDGDSSRDTESEPVADHVESTDKPQPSPSESEARTPPPPKRPGRTSRRSSGPRRPWLWPLVSLILLAVLVAAGYWGVQQLGRLNQNWQSLTRNQEQLVEQVDTLQSRLGQSERARANLEDQLRSELAAQEEMLVETAQRLSRRQDLEADRWPLEEALALLRLAERRLQLDQNAEVALRLLNAADQVLAGLTQAAVLPVRRQIAQDRLALQSVESPDINGLYFRLDAVHETLAALDWTPEDAVTPKVQPDPDSAWKAFVDSLGSLVTITRLDTAYQAPPLLDDFARWQQHALLLAEQAQLALLAGNQALYDTAVRQLLDHLQPMRETLKLQPVVDELNALHDTRLNPDWPDIHGSVRALEDYMARAETENSDSDPSDSAEQEGTE